MASSSGVARDHRGKLREAASSSRTTPTTLSFPTLRAAAACSTATTPSVELLSSIQSRQLRANPAAPLLWNRSTLQDNTTLQHRTRSNLSLSTLHSSLCDLMEVRHGNQLNGSVNSDRRGSTTAHVIQPHKPTPNQTVPLTGAQQGEGTVPSSGASNPNAGRAKKVAAVNYNALLQQEQGGQRPPSSPSPSPVPPSADVNTTSCPVVRSQRAEEAFPPLCGSSYKAGEGLMGGPEMDNTSQYPSSSGGLSAVPSLAPLGAVEGPLPPDVRRLISQSCAADPATLEAAEQQARRLISTGRRVKVYREELAAAEEEHRDWTSTAEQRLLVRSVLQSEVDDINARIQALLQERAICETQLRMEDEAATRENRKLAEAEERVMVLRNTIEGIVEETTVPRLMLQQLVPSLLIENYI